MKKKHAPYKSANPFFENMLKDPEIRVFYEEEKAKTEIAMAVQASRFRAHLTQQELAKKIGTSQSVIARIESGKDSRTPTLSLLARIAAACGGAFQLKFLFSH